MYVRVEGEPLLSVGVDDLPLRLFVDDNDADEDVDDDGGGVVA